jgi:hypothetical protein
MGARSGILPSYPETYPRDAELPLWRKRDKDSRHSRNFLKRRYPRAVEGHKSGGLPFTINLDTKSDPLQLKVPRPLVRYLQGHSRAGPMWKSTRDRELRPTSLIPMHREEGETRE